MIQFLVTCILWYLSSTVTNNVGKEILISFKYPVTLTMVQFGMCSIFAYIYGTYITKTLKPISKQVIKTTFPLALFQILGHIFASVALTYVTVSFSHTIKVGLES